MKVLVFIAFTLLMSDVLADIGKEGLLNRVGKLETLINDTLKKVAGHLGGLINDAELLVLKTQASLLKTLADTLNGVPIVGDLLLPTLQKTLETIEAKVDEEVKKIEALLIGQGTTAAPVLTTAKAKVTTKAL